MSAVLPADFRQHVDLIPGPAFDWESQAQQYPERGQPGLDVEQHYVDLASGMEVFPPQPRGLWWQTDMSMTKIDCLLMRDEVGVLVGILNHYDGRHPIEPTADAVNLWIRPDMQRRGLGRTMVLDAVRRWPGVTWEKQRYTPQGLALLESLGGCEAKRPTT